MRMRTLSSSLTFYCKFVVSVLFIMFLLLSVILLCSFHLKNTDSLFTWIFLLIWAGFAMLFVGRMVTWKRVRMALDSLHISNYLKEIQVPLSGITEVTERRWLGPRTVTVRFREPTAFGAKIRFRPTLLPMFWREHPVVAELRLAASGVTPTPQQLAEAIAADRRRMWKVIGLFVVLVVGFMILLQLMFRRSDPYRLGLQALTQDAAVIQVLGAPIAAGVFIGGQISVSGHSGCAMLDFPLHGARTEGDAHVYAFKADDAWHLSHVWVDLPDSPQKLEVVNAALVQADAQCARQGQPSSR